MTAARIRRLTLTNFRSYRAQQIAVAERLVVLAGPNGAGKTNLIEAISYLSPGRGLRRATLSEAAFTEGDGSWAVSAQVEGALGLATLGTGIEPPSINPSETRKCRVDGEAVGSAAAFADHLSVIWLVPTMDQLFIGPASERRRFIDRLALAIDASHNARVNALERSLRARNRLLENPRPDAQWLDAAEHETAELAVAVAAGRAETVRQLRRHSSRRRDDSHFPAARIVLEGAIEAGLATAPGRRDRGRVSCRAAAEPRARRRRRPHARRPAPLRPQGVLRGQGHRGRRWLDRRTEGAADRPRARACGSDRRDDRPSAGAAARRSRRASRSGAPPRAVTISSIASARRYG